MRKKWLIIPLLLTVVAINAQETTTNEIPVIDEETNITNTETITTTDTNLEPIDTTENTNMTNTTISNDITNQTTSEYVETVGYTIQQGDILYASPTARFEVQGIDEESGVKAIMVSIDGGKYSSYKAPISFTSEGVHTISYQFIDRVGNISYSKTFEVIIDATPPRVLDIEISPALYKASGYNYVGPNTSISFLAHDDSTGVAYIEYSTNKQDFIYYSSNFTLSSIGATNMGILELSYQATDLVSNVSPLKTETLFVDAVAPTINIFAKVFEKDGIRYISSKDSIKIEAFDSDTKVNEIYYAINEDEYKIYNKEIGINLKEAGEYDIHAKAIDVVGNESKEIVYSVVVDMVPPTGNALYIGEEKSTNYKDTEALGTVQEPTQYTESVEPSADLSTETTTPQEVDDITTETNYPTEEYDTDTEEDATLSEEVPAGTSAPVTE